MKKSNSPTMTVRHFLNGRRRMVKRLMQIAMGVIGASFIGLAVVGIVSTKGPRSGPPWPFFAFVFTMMVVAPAILGISQIYANSVIRCPWCGGNLAVLMQPFAKLGRLECCPFCSTPLDAMMPDGDEKPTTKPIPWDDEQF